jgi:hypothetical protein
LRGNFRLGIAGRVCYLIHAGCPNFYEVGLRIEEIWTWNDINILLLDRGKLPEFSGSFFDDEG